MLPSKQTEPGVVPEQQPLGQLVGLQVLPESVPPLVTTAVHTPLVQVSVPVQALQATPCEPQAAGVLAGLTHLLAESQQPAQLAGPHLGSPQDGIIASRKPMVAPSARTFSFI
jgi:hypothetical protein